MSAVSKLFTITCTVVLPWAIIRLTNFETKILDFLENANISDVVVVAILILPLLILSVTKWLFEPTDSIHKSYSIDKDLLVKFRK